MVVWRMERMDAVSSAASVRPWTFLTWTHLADSVSLLYFGI